jgi:hypothetical protein
MMKINSNIQLTATIDNAKIASDGALTALSHPSSDFLPLKAASGSPLFT